MVMAEAMRVTRTRTGTECATAMTTAVTCPTQVSGTPTATAVVTDAITAPKDAIEVRGTVTVMAKAMLVTQI